MTKMKMTMAGLLAALCVSAVACDEPPAPTPTDKPADKPADKPVDKPADKPAAKEKITGDKLAERIKDCYAALDAKDDKKLRDCYTADAKFEMVDSLPAMTAVGVDKIMATNKMLQTAFPDLKHEIGVLLVNGQNALVVSSMHGNNTGEMMGKPATDKEIGLLFGEVLKVTDDGKTQDAKIWMDQTSMMGQLGLLPPEAAGRSRDVWASGQFSSPTIVVAKNDQKEKDNVAVYDKTTDAFNKHDVDAMGALYADDVLFRDISMKDDIKGLEGVKKGLGDFYKMSSDVKAKIMWKWGAGDYVVAASTMTGTFDGSPDPNMKATQKPFTMSGLEVVKIVDGKVAEHWMFGNGYKFAVDVGLAPPPPDAPPATAEGDKPDDTKPATATP